jgi:hypothetical protein
MVRTYTGKISMSAYSIRIKYYSVGIDMWYTECSQIYLAENLTSPIGANSEGLAQGREMRSELSPPFFVGPRGTLPT